MLKLPGFHQEISLSLTCPAWRCIRCVSGVHTKLAMVIIVITAISTKATIMPITIHSNFTSATATWVVLIPKKMLEPVICTGSWCSTHHSSPFVVIPCQTTCTFRNIGYVWQIRPRPSHILNADPTTIIAIWRKGMVDHSWFATANIGVNPGHLG